LENKCLGQNPLPFDFPATAIMVGFWVVGDRLFVTKDDLCLLNKKKRGSPEVKSKKNTDASRLFN
jgi:hypothetical protein